MRNWNGIFDNSSIAFAISFYSTYEELKHHVDFHTIRQYIAYSTYEELKLGNPCPKGSAW